MAVEHQAASHGLAVVVPLVLAVILIVIALLLRALLAPVLLVAATALSFGASLGLASLLWRYAFGFSGVQSQVPAYILVFLVALGVDYDIFLSARIREEASRLGSHDGTLHGLAVTGGVITAAGVVLAGTFAALAQRPLVDITEVGTAVALGVLLDTLLIQPVVLPAVLLALGKRVWWPPRVARDRVEMSGFEPSPPTASNADEPPAHQGDDREPDPNIVPIRPSDGQPRLWRCHRHRLWRHPSHRRRYRTSPNIEPMREATLPRRPGPDKHWDSRSRPVERSERLRKTHGPPGRTYEENRKRQRPSVGQ
jgi:hypothetical protein